MPSNNQIKCLWVKLNVSLKIKLERILIEHRYGSFDIYIVPQSDDNYDAPPAVSGATYFQGYINTPADRCVRLGEAPAPDGEP